jgi:hypothetical protein
VSPVKYELGFYIPEDDILHSDRHGSVKSYVSIPDDVLREREVARVMPRVRVLRVPGACSPCPSPFRRQ